MRHAEITKPDREFVTISFLTRFANRCNDAAPIGIFTGNRCFHERGIGNRHRNALGRLPIGGTFNRDLHEFAAAFTIAHDLMREIEQDLIKRLAESRQALVFRILDQGRAALGRSTCCKDHQCV